MGQWRWGNSIGTITLAKGAYGGLEHEQRPARAARCDVRGHAARVEVVLAPPEAPRVVAR